VLNEKNDQENKKMTEAIALVCLILAMALTLIVEQPT